MLKHHCFKKILVLILGGVSLSSVVSAQSYEEVYAESSDDVRAVMDLNKMEGKTILTDIFVTYELSISGLTLNGNRDRLPSILSSSLEAINISLNPTNDHVSFTCPVLNQLDKLKGAFGEHGMGLNNIFKKEYTIIKH
jgi:hypothetical protein